MSVIKEHDGTKQLYVTSDINKKFISNEKSIGKHWKKLNTPKRYLAFK